MDAPAVEVAASKPETPQLRGTPNGKSLAVAPLGDTN